MYHKLTGNKLSEFRKQPRVLAKINKKSPL